jgi:hypothetical protein
MNCDARCDDSKTWDEFQLDLANLAEVSTRHLSFVETGRSAPSRDMILRAAVRQVLADTAAVLRALT